MGEQKAKDIRRKIRKLLKDNDPDDVFDILRGDGLTARQTRRQLYFVLAKEEQ